MSTVSYKASFTRNMGDFESLRLEVGVEDSPRGKETTAEAYERVKKFVDERLLAEVEAVEIEVKNTVNAHRTVIKR